MEKNDIEKMKCELEFYKSELKDREECIKCLQEELDAVQCNNQELPTEPIKVAELLIYATVKRTNLLTGREYDGDVYSVSDLRQIAEHLLVYCNNSEDE